MMSELSLLPDANRDSRRSPSLQGLRSVLYSAEGDPSLRRRPARSCSQQAEVSLLAEKQRSAHFKKLTALYFLRFLRQGTNFLDNIKAIWKTHPINESLFH